jgi:transcriptional regulator with XRE-family HTH domain
VPSSPAPYQAVIRVNLRRIRAEKGWRQEDVAVHARQLGLRWDAATVTAIELGRRQLSAGELLLLPSLLDAPLTELLLSGDGADFDGVAVPEAGLKWIARGRPLDLPAKMLVLFAKVEAGATDAERKAARQLGLQVLDLIATTQRLWEGRRLDQERDRRLGLAPGKGDIARRRGAITKGLLRELREELTPRTAWEMFQAETQEVEE